MLYSEHVHVLNAIGRIMRNGGIHFNVPFQEEELEESAEHAKPSHAR